MEEVMKILYEKFLMRDLLGKVTPGLFTLVALRDTNFVAWIWPTDRQDLTLVLGILVFGVSYLLGLSLQISGEYIGLHSRSPLPDHVMLLKVRWLGWKRAETANKHFDERFGLIENAQDGKLSKKSSEVRERFVFLKEGSGTFALAALVVSLVLGKYQLELWVLAVVLFLSHRLHARRQAQFEISMLETAGLLTSEKAREMQAAIKS